MREPTDALTEAIASAGPGLDSLLAEANAAWAARGTADEEPAHAQDTGRVDAPETVAPRRPGWRAFEDAFPTFYQFTNRPR